MHNIYRYALLFTTICACVPEDAPATTTSDSTTGSSPECQVDADCPGVCVDARCVECQINADCSDPTPICVGEVCQGCSLEGQCSGTTPVCEEDVCVPCTSDAQCHEFGDDVCVQPPSPDAGSCGGCSTNDDCTPAYPECVAMQCTVLCEVDPWENAEPHLLFDHVTGGVIEGFVCQSDLTDSFLLPIAGPSFVSLELHADTKPGNVDMVLLNAGNVVVAQSNAHSGIEVIHARALDDSDLQIQVSLSSGPAGAPYKLIYRTLPE